MTKYGCYNRDQLQETAVVQAGWYDQFCTRKPAMVVIDVPMTKHCQYQRDKPDDPKFDGCRWLECPSV